MAIAISPLTSRDDYGTKMIGFFRNVARPDSAWQLTYTCPGRATLSVGYELSHKVLSSWLYVLQELH